MNMLVFQSLSKQEPMDVPIKRPEGGHFQDGSQQQINIHGKKFQTFSEDLLTQQIKDLSVEIKGLRKTLESQKKKYEVISDKIYSLPSNEWALIAPVNIVLKISQDETMALIPDLKLYAEGRNEIEAVAELKNEILDLLDGLFEEPDDTLSGEFKRQKDSLIHLVKRISDLSTKESNSTEIDDCSLEKAKGKIALYFRENDGQEISYSELLDNLNLDFDLIIEACDELESEGKIG